MKCCPSGAWGHALPKLTRNFGLAQILFTVVLQKSAPWAEHLTSLPTKGVFECSAFKSAHMHVMFTVTRLKQITGQIIKQNHQWL